MKRRNGFTLIELLVVIAIIAILAAIIFPVYATARKSAYKSSDLSNMNALRTALQLYKADNGAYPPALLGYVGGYTSAQLANAIPPNQVRDALFPKRIESLTVLRPALNRIPENQGGLNAITAGYWPGTGIGTAGQSGQRYGRETATPVQRAYRSGTGCTSIDSNYYRISGYDVAPATNAASARMESHYQLFWTGYTVAADPCNPTSNESGSAGDNPRQLGYSEPPETTVVTWNPFFRDYTPSGTGPMPQNQKQDLVLFLGGSARPMDSKNVYEQAWATQP